MLTDKLSMKETAEITSVLMLGNSHSHEMLGFQRISLSLKKSVRCQVYLLNGSLADGIFC